MSHYYQTNAITLSRQDARENDRVFSFYTEQQGKVTAFAISSKKIKSRLAGHLEPFGIAEVGIVRGYRKSRVANARVRLRYNKIFEDTEKIFCAGYCLRLVDELVKGGIPDSKIYHLLSSCLAALDEKNIHGNIKILNAVFTLKLLSLLGYEPQARDCVSCKKILAEKNNAFSFMLGGILCNDCKKKDASGVEIATNDIKLLRFVLHEDIIEVLKLKADNEIYKKFNNIVSKFLAYHLK